MLAAYDGICWILGLVSMAAVAQLSGIGMPHGLENSLWLGPACALIHVAIGRAFRLHEGRAPLASFEDVVLLGTVTGLTGALLICINFSGALITDNGYFVRTVVALSGTLAALIAMLWGRAVYRIGRDRALARNGSTGRREPVVVIGAGEGARQLLASMFRDPNGTWSPVALLDDDPLKRHRRIRGVPVQGTTLEFPRVARENGARAVIVAIPSASSEFVRSLQTLARDEGLAIKVLPSANDLNDPNQVSIKDVRDIDVRDILGRHLIDTDVASIAGYLTGKRVLVTGAGGSIGSELCRQIAKFKPAELMMLDRDESALHAVELSIYGKAMLDTDETVLGDIRDTEFVNTLFRERRPEVVFHAAALKHLPLLEKAPGEAVKTNIWGTLTILEAAREHGVGTFVNISTDKAANPCSVLGYSKRLAEGLTAEVARDAEGTYMSVRFGNVLGSRGSVLTAFAKQIADGGPVTVTDPGVTRYFMTIQEACQLVIQAGAIGADGEVLILDMGDPISIKSVAEQLIELSGEDIGIVYTGLREGEKMHEELFGDHELDERPRHHLISHSKVPSYDAFEARALDPWAEAAGVTFAMERACADMVSELQITTKGLR